MSSFLIETVSQEMLENSGLDWSTLSTARVRDDAKREDFSRSAERPQGSTDLVDEDFGALEGREVAAAVESVPVDEASVPLLVDPNSTKHG